MNMLVKEPLLRSLGKVKLPICESCLTEKAYKSLFYRAHRVRHPLYMFHFEINGLINVKARHGAAYFFLSYMSIHAILYIY